MERTISPIRLFSRVLFFKFEVVTSFKILLSRSRLCLNVFFSDILVKIPHVAGKAHQNLNLCGLRLEGPDFALQIFFSLPEVSSHISLRQFV